MCVCVCVLVRACARARACVFGIVRGDRHRAGGTGSGRTGPPVTRAEYIDAMCARRQHRP